MLIVNPASGRGRAPAVADALRASLQALGARVEVVATVRRGDAPHRVAQALADGYVQFASVGGDGTAHEVVNGLMSAPWPEGVTPLLAVVPVGTGNDWARTLGLPRGPAALAELMVAGRSELRDIGRAWVTGVDGAPMGHTAYFANIAGAGIDAHVAGLLGDRKGGALSYLATLLRGWRSFRPPTFRLGAELGKGVSARCNEETCALLVAFAGLGRYCGGGMCVNPDGPINQGRLRVTEVGVMTGWQLLIEVRRLFDGTIGRSRHVRARDADALRVTATRPVPVQADGELIGTTPVRFDVLPRALAVVVGQPL
jgi:YegS/Rv2252/BmrU family lipid kinase